MTKDELYEQHLQEVVGIRDIDNYPEKDVERVIVTAPFVRGEEKLTIIRKSPALPSGEQE